MIIALAFICIELAYGIITSRWDHVYYISGTLGLVNAGIALFIFMDRLISGDGRRGIAMKQSLIASVFLFIPAVIGFILK